MKAYCLGIIYSLLPCLAQAQDLKPPARLEAKWEEPSGTINLSWDPLEDEIAGYHLFVQQPGQDKMYLWAAAGQISATEYSFLVRTRYGGHFVFQVAGFRNFPKVIYGLKSDPVEVWVPPTFLPMVNNVQVKNRKNEVIISWEYTDEMPELAGFELTLNDSTIQVSSEVTEYHLANLKPATYAVHITAVAKSGLKSETSPRKLISIK